MSCRWARRLAAAALVGLLLEPTAGGYAHDYTAPSAGGCPVPNRFDVAAPIARRWSTSLPPNPTILTLAQAGSPAHVDEIEQAILESFGAWTGVAGTSLNSSAHPSALGPLQRTATQAACGNSFSATPDGQNSICFNQASPAFSAGVLAFTLTTIADAPGAAGSTGSATFPGQILESDILVRADGATTFATPAAIAAHPESYDLESILIHELGHFLGLDHSAVWRAAMFPFAPAPGQFLGVRPTPEAPDSPLADDDRVGLRALYADSADGINVGVIAGRILPANPFSLAALDFTSALRPVTGVFGAHVVAVDADTGEVVAGVLSGWSCDSGNPPARFDGSYRIERLPLDRNYKLYVEPLAGVVGPGDVAHATASACRLEGPTPCLPPPVDTDFVTRPRTLP